MLKYGLIIVSILCAFGALVFALMMVLGPDLSSEHPPQDTGVTQKPPAPQTGAANSGAVVTQKTIMTTTVSDGGQVSVRDIRKDKGVMVYTLETIPSLYEVASPTHPREYSFGYSQGDNYFNIFIETTDVAAVLVDAESEFLDFFSVSLDDYCRLNKVIIHRVDIGKTERVTSSLCGNVGATSP